MTRFSIRALRFFALCLSSLLFVSCSTQYYAGDRRSKEQVATLKENRSQYRGGYFVSLWKVNGQRVYDTTFGIDVAPGSNKVTVLVHSPPTRGNPEGYYTTTRTIRARADHVYVFEVASGGSRTRPKLAVRSATRKSWTEKLGMSE